MVSENLQQRNSHLIACTDFFCFATFMNSISNIRALLFNGRQNIASFIIQPFFRIIVADIPYNSPNDWGQVNGSSWGYLTTDKNHSSFCKRFWRNQMRVLFVTHHKQLWPPDRAWGIHRELRHWPDHIAYLKKSELVDHEVPGWPSPTDSDVKRKVSASSISPLVKPGIAEESYARRTVRRWRVRSWENLPAQ